VERFELSGEGMPHIHITGIGSDLRLRGWDQPAVASKGDHVDIHQAADGTITIMAESDASLRVPFESHLTVESVGSDAKITNLDGSVTVSQVGADLSLRGVSGATIGTVGGDLRVKRVAGPVQIGRVGGDATVREIEGAVTLEAVGGDLYVRDMNGPCRVEQVGGDLVLSTDFMPGAAYTFTVGGDVVCRVPPGADVRFRVSAGADVSVDVADAEIIEGDTHDEIVFGSGTTVVELQAGGDIQFVGQDEDYIMAINFQLEEDLEMRLAGLEEQITRQLSGLDEQIARKAERIREKAEKQAERAARHAERIARKATRGKRKREWSFSFGGSKTGRAPRSAPPAEPVDPVTDEERLTILRMVERKQITVEEAEKLLAALEGRV